MKKILVITLLASCAAGIHAGENKASAAASASAAGVEQKNDKLSQVLTHLNASASDINSLATKDAEELLNGLKTITNYLGKTFWLTHEATENLRQEKLSEQIGLFVHEVNSQKFKESLTQQDAELLKETNKELVKRITFKDQSEPQLKDVIHKLISELVLHGGGQTSKETLISTIAREIKGLKALAQISPNIDLTNLSNLATDEILAGLPIADQLKKLAEDHDLLGKTDQSSKNISNQRQLDQRQLRVVSIIFNELLSKLVENPESINLQVQLANLKYLLEYIQAHLDIIDKENLVYIRNTVLELFGELLIRQKTKTDLADIKNPSDQATKLAELISEFKSKLEASKIMTKEFADEIGENLAPLVKKISAKADIARATL